MRRHCSALYSETLNVISKNPPMADLLLDVLDPEQMDDGMYFKVLQYLVKKLKGNLRTQEICLVKMKVGDRGSREGITESYRMSMIRFIIAELPEDRNVIFEVRSELIVILIK